MKPLVLSFMAVFALQWACAETPVAKPLDLSGVSASDIIATIEHMQRLVHAAEAKLLHAAGKTVNLSAQLIIAEQQKEMVQKKIDDQKIEIAKLEEKLRRWLIFGRTVLAVVFGAAFLLAWRLTQGITKAPATAWSWVLRVTICLAAGAAASSGVFYVITTLL